MKQCYIIILLLSCFQYAFGGNRNIENLEIGLFDSSHSKLLGEQAEGTTLMETASISLSLAFAESLNKMAPYVSYQYSNVVVDGQSYPLTFGVSGTSNPKELSLKVAPKTGTVYTISARENGYIIIFSKFNLGKPYYVFENDAPKAYTLGFITTDEISSVFSLPNDINGDVDFDSPQLGDYADSELRLKPISEIKPSLGVEGNGSGFIMFPVEKGKNYMVCANGSKMNCGGYIFSRLEPKNIGFCSDSGDFYDLIGDHRDNFNRVAGGIMTMAITGLNGSSSIYPVTDSTIISFDNGGIGIGTDKRIDYNYSITDLKNIIYLKNPEVSTIELSTTDIHKQNVPFYIYRKDGVINSYFSDEITRFSYSHLDQDSIYYEGIKTQYIHTQDTIYSIDIELIDSISFTAPPTIYNKDVVHLEKELKEYIVLASENNITFRKEIPANLLPKIGDILVQLNPNDLFAQPFFGRVIENKEIETGICSICEDVELTDVFDSYCATFMSRDVESTTRSDIDSNLCMTLNGGMELNFDLSLIPGVGNLVGLKIAEGIGITNTAVLTPRIEYLINYRGTLIVDKEHGVNLRVNIDSDYDLSTVLEIVRELNVSQKWKFFNINLPIPTPLLSVDIEVGAFLEANASVILNNQTNDRYKFILNWEWCNKKDLSQNNKADIRKMSHKRTTKGILSGDISIGLYAACNIHPFRLDILNISPEYKAGLKLASSMYSINWNINNEGPDERLYDEIKDNPIGIFWTRNFDLNFEAGPGSHSIPVFPNVSTLNGDTPILTCHHVPSFYNFTTKYNNGDLEVKTNIKNSVTIPVNLGFALVNDKTNELLETQYKVNSYTDYPTSMQHTFKVDPSETSYTVYPLIKWYGFEMFGSPAAKYQGICPDDYHPHLIDLGLPSNKMWVCCNHGAISPEGSGLYLAWGESEEKSYYKYRTYKYWNDKNDNDRWDEGEFDDIGSNIQGTEYDPVSSSDSRLAMPTKEEYQELITNCKWESYTFNGEKGSLLTGPNGKQLFLPGSGMMVDYDLAENGSGRYWTSNVDPKDHCDAVLLSFSGSNPSFTTGDRHNGRTIRPIAKYETSVGEINADQFDNLIIEIKDRTVRITTPKECSITINTIDGFHSTLKLSTGTNELTLSPGFYIINGQKVIVK